MTDPDPSRPDPVEDRDTPVRRAWRAATAADQPPATLDAAILAAAVTTASTTASATATPAPPAPRLQRMRQRFGGYALAASLLLAVGVLREIDPLPAADPASSAVSEPRATAEVDDAASAERAPLPSSATASALAGRPPPPPPRMPSFEPQSVPPPPRAPAAAAIPPPPTDERPPAQRSRKSAHPVAEAAAPTVAAAAAPAPLEAAPAAPASAPLSASAAVRAADREVAAAGGAPPLAQWPADIVPGTTRLAAVQAAHGAPLRDRPAADATGLRLLDYGTALDRSARTELAVGIDAGIAVEVEAMGADAAPDDAVRLQVLAIRRQWLTPPPLAAVRAALGLQRTPMVTAAAPQGRCRFVAAATGSGSGVDNPVDPDDDAGSGGSRWLRWPDGTALAVDPDGRVIELRQGADCG